MRFKVISAVSITRTGAFYPAESEIKLDEHLNQKEVDFLLKKKVIEEIAPPKSPAKKAPAKKPVKKG